MFHVISEAPRVTPLRHAVPPPHRVPSRRIPCPARNILTSKAAQLWKPIRHQKRKKQCFSRNGNAAGGESCQPAAQCTWFIASIHLNYSIFYAKPQVNYKKRWGCVQRIKRANRRIIRPLTRWKPYETSLSSKKGSHRRIDGRGRARATESANADSPLSF